MKRVSLPLALLLVAGCLLGGCQLTESSMVVRSTGGVRGPTGFTVEPPPPELAKRVRVVRAVPRTDTGERVAQIDVENITREPVALEYQIRWRDQFGAELIQLWEWRNITVPPGKTVRLEDEVMDSEWVHYTCELRLRK